MLEDSGSLKDFARPTKLGKEAYQKDSHGNVKVHEANRGEG